MALPARRISIIRRSILANDLGLLLPSVEVPVTSTRRACERLPRAIFAARHELPAAIHRVTADVGGVVLQALTIPHSASHHSRACGCLVSLHHHLPFLHYSPKNHKNLFTFTLVLICSIWNSIYVPFLIA